MEIYKKKSTVLNFEYIVNNKTGFTVNNFILILVSYLSNFDHTYIL